jgi:hypothetical protein
VSDWPADAEDRSRGAERRVQHQHYTVRSGVEVLGIPFRYE